VFWKSNFQEHYANEDRGACAAGAPVAADSHRKNETPTNSISESIP
jgi:hypothetical protein